MSDTPINVEIAREIAEAGARLVLARLNLADYKSILRDDYSEADNCWFFYRKAEIVVPEGMLTWSSAFAVSKRSTFRAIPDFSSNPQQLSNYLKVMSDHFRDRNL